MQPESKRDEKNTRDPPPFEFLSFLATEYWAPSSSRESGKESSSHVSTNAKMCASLLCSRWRRRESLGRLTVLLLSPLTLAKVMQRESAVGSVSAGGAREGASDQGSRAGEEVAGGSGRLASPEKGGRRVGEQRRGEWGGAGRRPTRRSRRPSRRSRGSRL